MSIYRMENSIRLYKEKIPQIEDIVVVSLNKYNEDNAHECSLLEFGNIKGVITRVDIGKRDKTFKNLKQGSVFLIVVSNVTMKENSDEPTKIDLHYTSIDDDKIKTHIERYQQFLTIINAFKYIANINDNNEPLISKHDIRKQRKLLKKSNKMDSAASTDSSDTQVAVVDNSSDISISQTVSFNSVDENDKVNAIVNIMMDETLYKYEKEDVENMFFKDTIQLHEVAKQWIQCNKIPKFMDKLIIRFPKQKININMVIECTTAKCNGLLNIKNFFQQLKSKIIEHDDKSIIDIAIQSMPLCNINIKSDLITPSNCTLYLGIIKEFIDTFNDKHMSVNIKSCYSDSSTSVKTNLLTDSTDLLEDDPTSNDIQAESDEESLIDQDE